MKKLFVGVLIALLVVLSALCVYQQVKLFDAEEENWFLIDTIEHAHVVLMDNDFNDLSNAEISDNIGEFSEQYTYIKHEYLNE